MIRLTVAGMSCGHCVGAITKAVQAAVKGTRVTVDLAGAQIEVGGTDDADAVRKAIEDMGYEVLGRAA